MQNIYSPNKKVTCFAIAMSFIVAGVAQNTTSGQTGTSSYNLLAMLMMAVALILAFVIWGMGKAVLMLGRELLDRNKKNSTAVKVTMIAVFLLLSQYIQAEDTQETLVDTTTNYGGLSSLTFYLVASVIGTEIVVIFFLFFSIKRLYSEIIPRKQRQPWQFARLAAVWQKLNQRFFTKAVPVEQESDIMLDHDYDGIKELDNALPPWWKMGFIITIGIAIVYLLYFEVFDYGKNPTEEYNTEVANARIKKEIYEANNKDKIDENNVPMADAAGLAAGKELYTTKCFACHGQLGEGGAGPNLTDEFWLHKGSLNDVYHTIIKGYPDKGMQSWAKEFSPKEISFLASYVKTLKGTNPPNAKAPQGDLYREEDLLSPSQQNDSSQISRSTMDNKSVSTTIR